MRLQYNAASFRRSYLFATDSSQDLPSDYASRPCTHIKRLETHTNLQFIPGPQATHLGTPTRTQPGRRTTTPRPTRPGDLLLTYFPEPYLAHAILCTRFAPRHQSPNGHVFPRARAYALIFGQPCLQIAACARFLHSGWPPPRTMSMA